MELVVMAESAGKVPLHSNIHSTTNNDILWDPFSHSDNEPTPQSLLRIRR